MPPVLAGQREGKQGGSNPGVAKVETALNSGTVEAAVGILEADVVC